MGVIPANPQLTKAGTNFREQTPIWIISCVGTVSVMQTDSIAGSVTIELELLNFPNQIEMNGFGSSCQVFIIAREISRGERKIWHKRLPMPTPLNV